MHPLDDIIDKELLELLRERVAAEIAQKESVIGEYQYQVERLNEKLDRVDLRIAEFSTKQAPAVELTPTGRVKRGASMQLVEEFFKKSNGTGATIQQVVSATGTKYGTVRRCIMELELDSKIETAGDSAWRWVRENLSAVNSQKEAGAT